jgi:hypothetical protein
MAYLRRRAAGLESRASRPGPKPADPLTVAEIPKFTVLLFVDDLIALYGPSLSMARPFAHKWPG